MGVKMKIRNIQLKEKKASCKRYKTQKQSKKKYYFILEAFPDC